MTPEACFLYRKSLLGMGRDSPSQIFDNLQLPDSSYLQF